MTGSGNSVSFYEMIYGFIIQRQEHDMFFVANLERELTFGNTQTLDYDVLQFLEGRTLFSILDENCEQINILTF